MTGGVAQAVEHLLCRCKVLSSNPSSMKKKLTYIGRLVLQCCVILDDSHNF
jgi:hypothetical protein